VGAAPTLSNRAQHFAAMPDRNTNVLEILLGQIAQDAYGVDPVIGKALGASDMASEASRSVTVATRFPRSSTTEGGTGQP